MPAPLPFVEPSLSISVRALLGTPRKPVCAPLGPSTLRRAALAADFSDTIPTSGTDRTAATAKAPLSGWHRQRCQPLHDCPEQPPRQVPFSQEQPEIPSMFDQPATRLHEALLQAR